MTSEEIDKEIASEIIKKKSEHVCPFCAATGNIYGQHFKCSRFGWELAGPQDDKWFIDEVCNKLLRYDARPFCPILNNVLITLKKEIAE